MSKQQFNVGFKITTYTGDGGVTKQVTGVGFQPDLVVIYPQLPGSTGSYVGIKTDQDGASAFMQRSGGAMNYYGEDHIISLDPDGFTVGDGTPLGTNFMNVNGRNYVAICLS